MQRRLAKKIVRRVESGNYTAKSYHHTEIAEAFTTLGKIVPVHGYKPHEEADQARALRQKEAYRQTAGSAKARKEAAREANAQRRKAREAQRQRAIKAKAEREQAAVEEARRQAEAHIAEGRLHDLAVAHARDAFNESMKADIDEMPVPDSGVIEDVPPDIKSVTKADLVEEAKSRGITGYSGLKKADLYALVYGQQAE